jgi:Zn finger protein HypA/HybF involved in hydrogenase expression
VSLRLDKYTFNFGDKLEGILTVSSEEEVDVTEIRAELRCNEKKKETRTSVTFGDHGGISRSTQEQNFTIYRENPQASGPIHLSAGYRGEFPFSTSIAGGQPSYAGDDRTVTWTVKGVIGIKGRPDVTSPTMGIQVAGAPTTITTEKIVEREIVMIPCEYCGGLFPQTVTTCPKCGAQRRA